MHIRLGLKIALADITEDALAEAGKEVAAIVGEANVLVIPTDVSKIEDVVRLRDKVYEAWGEVSSFRHKFIHFLELDGYYGPQWRRYGGFLVHSWT